MSEATPRKIVLKGKKVVGGVAEGEALVSPRPLMGWGMVNEKMGYTTVKTMIITTIRNKEDAMASDVLEELKTAVSPQPAEPVSPLPASDSRAWIAEGLRDPETSPSFAEKLFSALTWVLYAALVLGILRGLWAAGQSLSRVLVH